MITFLFSHITGKFNLVLKLGVGMQFCCSKNNCIIIRTTHLLLKESSSSSDHLYWDLTSWKYIVFILIKGVLCKSLQLLSDFISFLVTLSIACNNMYRVKGSKEWSYRGIQCRKIIRDTFICCVSSRWKHMINRCSTANYTITVQVVQGLNVACVWSTYISMSNV